MKLLISLSLLLFTTNVFAAYNCGIEEEGDEGSFIVEVLNAGKASVQFVDPEDEEENEMSICDIMPTGILGLMTVLCQYEEDGMRTDLQLNISTSTEKTSDYHVIIKQGQEVLFEHDADVICKEI